MFSRGLGLFFLSCLQVFIMIIFETIFQFYYPVQHRGGGSGGVKEWASKSLPR